VETKPTEVDVKPTKDGKDVRAAKTGPSKEEEQVFHQVEQILPKIQGLGRHTVAKYRFLYRSELDRSSGEKISTQRYRQNERCRENRLVSNLFFIPFLYKKVWQYQSEVCKNVQKISLLVFR
jgi:hypothetical protein